MNHMTKKSTERFTETVKNYSQYRPSYPKEILNVMQAECSLTQDKMIADVGSGTGILTKLFLDHGNVVYAVEPNTAMREVAEHNLKSYPHFHSIVGTAESTTLQNQSVDFVTVGTAFHWFDLIKTKQEFKRILKTPGWVVLLWNVRNKESQLIGDYENLILKYNTDYCESNASKFDKTVTEAFFTPFIMKTKIFKNIQYFNWESFQGRFLSSSYIIRSDDSRYEKMIEELKNIFDRYQKNGQIEFSNDTKIYYGQLSSMRKVW